MRPGRKKTILGVLTVFVCALTVFLIFGERYLRLHTDQRVDPADAVIALAGPHAEDRRRILASIELLHQKKATYLILPIRHPAFTWSWVVRNYHLSSQLPENRIMIGRAGEAGEQALQRYGGTFAEAQKSVEIMQHLGLRSAVVVSSGYHMRRVALAFNQNGKTTDLVFSYHAVGAIEPLWWTNPEKLRRILREYQKLIVAHFLYPTR